MRLTVDVPHRTVLAADVDRVTAEGRHGSFTLLPRHVDCVVPLTTGLLRAVVGGDDRFVAIDGGLLVKVGPEVRVATGDAVEIDTLEAVRATIDEAFAERGEHERRARRAMLRLESDAVRRLAEVDEDA